MSKKRARSQKRAKATAAQLRSVSAKLPRKVFERLPEDVRVSVMEAAAFSGPLPLPSMYGQCERVLEGSAERILAMAEKEQQRRTVRENKQLEVATSGATRGQELGFVVVIICVGSAVYLSSLGHQWVAGVVAGISVVGLVGRFVQGRSSGRAHNHSGSRRPKAR